MQIQYIALALLLLFYPTYCVGTPPSIRTSRQPSERARLNRILENRQAHEYQTRRSFKILQDQGYDVYETPIIAGHYRQLRALRTAQDVFLENLFLQEKHRMDLFVKDVDEVNVITRNALFYSLGEVKDRRWDDLISFLMREIRSRS